VILDERDDRAVATAAPATNPAATVGIASIGTDLNPQKPSNRVTSMLSRPAGVCTSTTSMRGAIVCRLR
jgi:hypothetical protein